jgi:transposase
MVILARRWPQMEAKGLRVVGFDCAEEEHAAVLLDGGGEFERQIRVTNVRHEIQDCLAKLILATGSSADLVVVVESRRSHGRLVADEATRLGCRVMQVNTVALNHYRDVEGQPRKDDDWDAYLAARMAYLRLRGCREVVEISEEERGLSRLTRSHSRLSEDRNQQLARLRALLLELAPEVLNRSWEGPKPGSRAMRYLLERWPGLEGLERAQLRSIENILHRCRYGDRAEPVAKLVRDMARRISVDGEERLAITLEADALVRQIAICDELVDRVFREIDQRVQRHPVGIKLLEMHGVGPVIAGVLVSELLPVARTVTEAASATYAGVTPLGRKTGKGNGTAHLSQGVNKRVLHALYISSVAASKHSAIDKAYYQKKLRDYAGHTKPHVAAYIALSRQRHKVIFKLMTTDARYDKEKLIASHLERIEAERAAAA